MTNQKEKQEMTMGGAASFQFSTAKGPCWLSKKTCLDTAKIYQQHFENYDDAVNFGGSIENVRENEEVYYQVEWDFDLESFRKQIREMEHEGCGLD